MGSTLSASLEATAQAPRIVSRFWVASYPFFETTLLMLPGLQDDDERVSKIRLFDCDGEQVNELTAIFPPGEVGTLELDPLMESCKLESGLKQAQLIVDSAAGSTVFCRLHSQGGAALLSPAASITEERAQFFPLTFSASRAALICLVNHGADTARARCRLYCGKRTPERVITVPPRGTRAVLLEACFPEYTQLPEDRQLSGYLKVNARDDTSLLGVQFIERIERGAEGEFFNPLT